MNLAHGWMFAAVIGMIATIGCGGAAPATIPVKGVLLIDGKPEEGISVNFVDRANPGKNPARGTTDAEGKFALTTFNTNDGAVAGEYRVTVARMPKLSTATPTVTGPEMLIQKQKKVEESGGAAPEPTIEPLPAKYASPDTTPLSATVGKVAPGQTEFTIEVATK